MRHGCLAVACETSKATGTEVTRMSLTERLQQEKPRRSPAVAAIQADTKAHVGSSLGPAGRPSQKFHFR